MKIKLSPQEKHLVKLLKQGYNNKKAAEPLMIKEKTVSTVKSRVKFKLQLAPDINDYVLVQKCIENNLI